MAQYPAQIALGSLTGANGFRLRGAAAGDAAGYNVAPAGDVNGDGYADVIVGSERADPNGSNSGASYVVFGRAGGFSADLDPATLNGTNGFRLVGALVGDNSGWSVASAGDFNGDGLGDLVIGAPFADPTGASSGATYVVYGRRSGFSGSIDLASLSGAGGFRITGVSAGDNSGWSATSAGDFNRDGLSDLIIGAYNADPSGAASGTSYVVYGRRDATTGFSLSRLNGANGFAINGAAAGDLSGQAVNAAGDVNADGYDDVIIGATGYDYSGRTNSGGAFVLLGRAANAQASVSLSTLSPPAGFRITGDYDDAVGSSVASAGDVNGDGYDDVVLRGQAGEAHVVFGRGGGFLPNYETFLLGGANGLTIAGLSGTDLSNRTVASAGDVNGDGFADLIIGSHTSNLGGTQRGVSHVVFGRATFPTRIELGSLNGTDGFAMVGVSNLDYSGIAVGSAGDVNADGFDDMLVGAYGVDANGVDSGAPTSCSGGGRTRR